MTRPDLKNLFIPTINTNANFYRAMMYTNLSSLSFHAAFIFIFWLAGITPMAVFNMVSITVLSISLLMQRRGKIVASIIITTLELLAHAIAAVYFLGWEPGFQQYLLALAAYAFMIPRRPVLSTCMVIVTFLCYTFLYYYSLSVVSVYAGHEAFLKYFFIPNTLVAICNAVYAISYYMKILDKAETDLEDEHARSESLLNNILPAPIAARLKKDKGTIANQFDDVSILFADIEGFTPFSEQRTPTELVNVLNDIFLLFDAFVEKYPLEKIKTIGDAYMVAAGVPVAINDHAGQLANCALDMQNAFRKYTLENSLNLQLRIGINSGSVVAGVIGKLRFIYDVWGDCVNTASRMESHGIAGEIQISETTYDRLKNRFDCKERGLIEVKGKGMMKTWLLGRRIES